MMAPKKSAVMKPPKSAARNRRPTTQTAKGKNANPDREIILKTLLNIERPDKIRPAMHNLIRRRFPLLAKVQRKIDWEIVFIGDQIPGYKAKGIPHFALKNKDRIMEECKKFRAWYRKHGGLLRQRPEYSDPYNRNIITASLAAHTYYKIVEAVENALKGAGR
jgi:hypothetical protein